MRISIKIKTMHGNSITAPRGIDTFELPFNRIRLLKNANLGPTFSFCLLRSSRDGREGVEGMRLARL